MLETVKNSILNALFTYNGPISIELIYFSYKIEFVLSILFLLSNRIL